MRLIQYPQETGEKAVADQILALEETAWPRSEADAGFPSAPGTYVTSFVLMDGEKAVCHVGVRAARLSHRGRNYRAFGLSEVVTHPQYRGRGLASRLILRAGQFIQKQDPDISVFTCAAGRVPLYTRCGWEAAPGACLVGGTRERPFRSDSLGLVTMIRFLSPKGIRHRGDFENTDLFLELGEGQLW